jgi:hypothetical protein
MVNKNYSKLGVHWHSHYLNGIIPDEMLTIAAEAAAKLCNQSGPAVGGTLHPCHFSDYQQLLCELAAKEHHD